MRNLEELLKTQIVSSASTINHALQLNEELDSLRKECKQLRITNEALTSSKETIMVEREEHLKTIQALKRALEEFRTTSEWREEKLQLQLNQLQASWNSLYDDLAKVRDERNELKARLEAEEEKTSLPQGENRFGVSPNCTEKPFGEDGSGIDQAELLRQAVNRHNSFSPGVSFLEKKIHNLEIENLKQKSTIVKLQTQLKEDRYQKERAVSHLPMVREHQKTSVPMGRSLIAQSASSPPLAARCNSTKWPRDDDEVHCISSNLPQVGIDCDAASNETMKPPMSSASIRRIQEYKWKKEKLMSNDESHCNGDTRSVGTASTKTSTISADSTPSLLLSSRSRGQSLHPSSLTSASASPWGRRPARSLNSENHTILKSHPAYLTTTIDDESHSGFSSLGEALPPGTPNRVRSLVRWW